MSTQKNLDKVFEAYLTTFGIFIGLFFKFVYQHTLDNYKNIINLKELLFSYDLSDIPFDFIISESFYISNDVIFFVFIGIFFLFIFLLSIRLSTDLIQKNDYLFILVLLLVIISWCLFPIFIMKTTLNEQTLLIKFDIDNNINKDLLNQYYKYLDEYRYFGIRYIYEIKLLTFFTLMLSYLIIIKKSLIKINNKFNIIGVFTPIIIYMILNYFYLTSGTFPLYKSGELFSITIGKGTLYTHPLVVEPFKSYNFYLAIILTAIYFISLVKMYIPTLNKQPQIDVKKPRARYKKPRKSA